MGKGIFQRLLFTYAAVIIITVIMLAALMTYFSNQRLYEQKQNDLLKAGQSLENLAGEYYSQRISRDELARTSEALGQSTESNIYILDGQKISGLKSIEGQINDSQSEITIAEDLTQLLEGKVVRKKYFSNHLNVYVVFVGLPVCVDNNVRGVILLFSPQENLNASLFEIYKIIWGSAAASLALAAVIIFLVSRRISRPIENMQKAAAAIAEGNFVEDIDTSGRDEVANLAGTFNYMKNRLAVIEEMRKDLIANVSHELRTPLTSIRGFIQGILDGVIPPDQQEKYLKRAYNETGRLNRLVNDLLQMARLQTGNLSINTEQVDIAELLGEIADEYSLLALEKNIRLSAAADPDTTAPADRDKLKQVILNLVQNAINYTGEGGEISILAAVENDTLSIRVKDTGAGIPGDQMDLIFEKFHRVEKSRSQHVPGTGLGLSIARELAELHGGTMLVRSAVGRGTEFTVLLPLKGRKLSGV